VVEQPVRGSLVGSTVATSSVDEDGSFFRLNKLDGVTLALRDPRVMRWTAKTCLVMSFERVDQYVQLPQS